MTATHMNHVWTHDFVHDRTVRGGPLRMLTVEDEHTRERPAVEVDRSLLAGRAKAVLTKLFAEPQPLEYLTSEDGPEFIAQELMEWFEEQGVRKHHIEAGSS
jgi:transposase InsO family protein